MWLLANLILLTQATTTIVSEEGPIGSLVNHSVAHATRLSWQSVGLMILRLPGSSPSQVREDSA